MKKFFLLFLILFSSFYSFAGHIAGGEVYYRLLGPGTAANTNRYEVTLRLFRECNPPVGGQPTADLPTVVWLGRFNNTNPSTAIGNQIIVDRTSFQQLSMTTVNPCITNAPEVCYQVGLYTTVLELPITAEGYIISFQSCCRTNGINNLQGGSQGATYTATIPGTATVSGGQNSSPVFRLKDTSLVCRGTPFTLDFGAEDADGDSLVYSFCPAFNGGPTSNSAPVMPSNPPYGTVNYGFGYTGFSPLGAGSTINSQTGIITGNVPVAGSYVVNVCIAEFRNGVQISTHRKDFTLKIGNCQLTAAQLLPSYINCDDLNFTFQNESTASNITSYLWNFGEPSSGANNTSTLPVAPHQYKDTGVYTVKLVVTNAAGCQDSANTKVSVFPGFAPNFTFVGSCFQTPFQFSDKTVATYGTVNNWQWDFGEATNPNDTSSKKNPTWKYSTPTTAFVTLIVGSSKGCIDTISKTITVSEKPLLNLPFKDTLICSIDTLPLIVQTSDVATVKWTPNINISNTNIKNPQVWPKDTAVYAISVSEGVCTTTDSVRVNVLDFITVDIMPADTGMCLGDSIILRPVSHALSYLWTPSTALSRNDVKYPRASPANKITYYLTANLGKCQDKDSITVFVTPYPEASIVPVQPICFGDTVQLNATIKGSSFTWSPNSTLIGSNTLNPRSVAPFSTNYVLTVFDTIGCPKPFRDTVVVTVRPPVPAFAGNDTTVVFGQPLQLNASGGVAYSWSPAIGLNNTLVSDPLATYNINSPETVRYLVKVTAANGCTATDDILVRIFKTQPDIFIPTGFSPNLDGRNDVLRAIPVGIKQFKYFNIYNRWGQKLFSTSDPSLGWDGSFSGTDQQPGTYVFIAQGIDYTDKPVVKKGTVVLIR